MKRVRFRVCFTRWFLIRTSLDSSRMKIPNYNRMSWLSSTRTIVCMKKFVAPSCQICFVWSIWMMDNRQLTKRFAFAFAGTVITVIVRSSLGSDCGYVHEKDASSRSRIERYQVRKRTQSNLWTNVIGREKLSMYENVWQAPNDLMNCLKCGALLPFGQHNTEHNEKVADMIT